MKRAAQRGVGAPFFPAAAIPFHAGRFGGRVAVEDFGALPTLTRGDLALLHDSVMSQRPEAARLPRVRTSGSSGAPVWLLFDALHQRGRFAARARYLWENGWRPHQRAAWLIDILPGSPDGNLVRSLLLGGAHFFSHIETFERQLDWLRRLDPVHLHSMPSNLEGLVYLIESTPSVCPR